MTLGGPTRDADSDAPPAGPYPGLPAAATAPVIAAPSIEQVDGASDHAFPPCVILILTLRQSETGEGAGGLRWRENELERHWRSCGSLLCSKWARHTATTVRAILRIRHKFQHKFLLPPSPHRLWPRDLVQTSPPAMARLGAMAAPFVRSPSSDCRLLRVHSPSALDGTDLIDGGYRSSADPVRLQIPYRSRTDPVQIRYGSYWESLRRGLKKHPPSPSHSVPTYQ